MANIEDTRAAAFAAGNARVRVEESGEPFARLVSIDAWREPEGGWTWNNSHTLRAYSADEVREVLAERKPRALCAFLRREGYLADASKGKIRVDYAGSDPDYITIENKNTGEPIFAFIVRWDLDKEEIRKGQTELINAYGKHLDAAIEAKRTK